MRKKYVPELGIHENVLEAGDAISIVVDDETADRIRKEVAEEMVIRDKEILETLKGITAYMPLLPDLKAPNEWHEANFDLGMNKASAKEIHRNILVENKDSVELDEVKEPVGVRGAVASGQRQKDGSIQWDWNYEEEDVYARNLLDFYVLPEYRTDPEDFYSCMSYSPTKQHMDSMPSGEHENPLMAWKEIPEPTPEEREVLDAKAIMNMRKAACDEQQINAFIEKCKQK